jgi:hypothetical protein
VLPALSGIMPDSFRLTMARATNGRRDSARRQMRRQHAGGREQNARAPQFIRLPAHKNANAQRVTTIAPMAVANAAVHAALR